MNIEQIQAGPLSVNTYIITDEESGERMIIDPGQHNVKLRQSLKEMGSSVRYIVFTHGHFDHSADAAEIKDLCPRAKILIHEDDAEMLYDDHASLFLPLAGGTSIPIHADVLLKGGEKLTLGRSEIEVIHTPGHSEGGITLLTENGLFTGDTLFYHSIGRTDFPGGNLATLTQSVKKLFSLSGNYPVYPGHERGTSLEEEREHNPFVITKIGEKS